ncbi:hypothetical protein, partial [Polaromonas sp.]|uniref:hypothetical protein n=1 Tax=Polaromonas sp. TaxID=1869339 RepID=UPI0025D49DEA
SALIRLALRFSAPLQGLGEEDKYRDKTPRLASSASRWRLPGSESEPEFNPHPLEAGPRSGDGDGINGKNLFERSELFFPPT